MLMTNMSCINISDCVGCKACANSCPKDAIVFQEDECGFSYPFINAEICIQCGKCEQTCNAVKAINVRLPLKTFAAVNKDDDVLKASSSGGVFSVLAEYYLDKGMYLCGCVYDENLRPIHICTNKHEDYLRMRKSKYVQSDIGDVYRTIKNLLNNDKEVLFVGTPCQVAGLKGFLHKDYEKLLTVDLVCHGTPSYKMFLAFLDYLENKYSTKIVDFNFRSKKHGWLRISTEFTDEKGRTRNIGKNQEFYMFSFSNGDIMRSSCYSCRYAIPERVGDITIGDFWGYNKQTLGMSSVKGISLFTINTDSAMKILEPLSEKLVLKEVDYSEAINGNTCLRHPTKKGRNREKYMKALSENRIQEVAENYVKHNRKRIVIEKIKYMIPIRLYKVLMRRTNK